MVAKVDDELKKAVVVSRKTMRVALSIVPLTGDNSTLTCAVKTVLFCSTVGANDGECEGCLVGMLVGLAVFSSVGGADGALVAREGRALGVSLGVSEGTNVGNKKGFLVGDAVGLCGAAVGA
jgi:hypothetical protein